MSEGSPPDQPPPQPTGGFVSLKIRTPFGKDREVRPLGLKGYHVAVETCDDQPRSMYLITRANVHSESLAAFDSWSIEQEELRRKGKSKLILPPGMS